MAKGDGKDGGKSGGKGGGKGGKPSKAGGIVTVAALTVLALGAGAVTGKVIAGRLQQLPASVGSAVGSAVGSGAGSGVGAAPATKDAPYAGDTVLRELPPIVTNLAEPAETRIRLQLAIVFPKKGVEQPDILSGQVADDVVAFVKTLTVSQLQGASGLQALREDLADRVRTRSNGTVREVVIENLVVQ